MKNIFVVVIIIFGVFLIIAALIMYNNAGSSNKTSDDVVNSYIEAVKNQDQMEIRKLSLRGTSEMAILEALTRYQGLKISDVQITYLGSAIDSTNVVYIIRSVGTNLTGDTVNIEDRVYIQKYSGKWYLSLHTHPTPRPGSTMGTSIATPTLLGK